MYIAIILYIIAFGVSLFNHGAYWDDWAHIVGKSPEFIMNIAGRQAGYIVSAYIFNIINLFHSYTLYRVITFFAYLASGFFLYAILKSIKEINSKTRLLLFIYFLLFPANDARVVLVILHYSLSNFFFYFGWWLTSLYLLKKATLLRIVALFFLFLSFAVNSLLVFYLCVLVYIAYKEKKGLISFKRIFALLFHYIDFLLLPLVFFIAKKFFFTPFGQYEGYNAIKTVDVVTAIYRSFHAYVFSFLLPLLSCLYSLLNMSLITTVWQSVTKLGLHPYIHPLSIVDMTNLIKEIASLTLYILINKNLAGTLSIAGLSIFFVYLLLQSHFKPPNEKTSLKKDGLFFIIGCIAFYIAVYPYYVVNKIPSILEGFSDRHLLLVPLGAAFMIVYGIKMLCTLFHFSYKTSLILYSICISMFMSYHVRINIDFLKDWYKQVALMEQIKESQEIRDHTTFLFVDNTMEYNVKHRPYALYEYTGFMKAVFGNERRFGSNINEFVTFNNTIAAPSGQQMKFSQHNEYSNSFTAVNNMEEYKQKDPEYVIEINLGYFPLTDQNLIYLMYLERKDTFLYEQALKNIVQLSSTPIIQNQ